MKHFERLEQVFASGPLYIEPAYLNRVAARFLAEMDVWGSGDSAMDQIKERRKEQEPKLIVMESDGSFSVQDFDFSTLQARSGQFAHLKLSGAMQQEDFLSTQGISTLAAQIRQADAAPQIDGILIEANTGGGELIAGQTLRNAIKDAKKPVLVYAHYLASAGVWGTLFADHIMAAGKGSEIGSIGVYTQVSKGFLTMYKDAVLDVYSRKSPNKNKDFRSLLDGDASVLEDSVTQADEIFMADVKRNRPLQGDIEGTLSGAMFFADDAKGRGLVDSIGTFSDAVAELGRIVRAKNNNAMKKLSLVDLAKKFLGIAVASEEEAALALEEAPAPENAQAAVEAATAALESRIATLEATATQLADDLRTAVGGMTTVADAVKAITDASPLTADQVAASVKAATESLRGEVAAEINALRVSRKSGGEVAAEEDVRTGHEGEEAPKVDLLAGIQAKDVRVMRHLS